MPSLLRGTGKGMKMGFPRMAKKMLREEARQAMTGDWLDRGAVREQTEMAAQQAQQQAQQQMDRLSAQRLAQGGAPWSGEMASVALETAGEAAEKAAGAVPKAYRGAKESAERRYADLRARIERQQDRSRENAQYWTQFGIDASGALNNAISTAGSTLAQFK